MSPLEYASFVNKQFRGRAPLIDKDIVDMFIYSVGLPGEIGEALEHLKKQVRDGKFDREKFILEMGDALFYYHCILIANEITLEEVMEANMDKLVKRNAIGYWGSKEKNLELGNGTRSE